MGEIITLGGDHVDPSDKLQRLITDNSVYVDSDPVTVWGSETELEPSPADNHTSAWLNAISAVHRISGEL